MFNNSLQILQPICEKWQHSDVSYFFCAHHGDRFLYKMHLHMPKRKHARAKSLLGMWLEIFELQENNINVKQKLVEKNTIKNLTSDQYDWQ